MIRLIAFLLGLLIVLVVCLLAGCTSTPVVPTRITAEPVPSLCSAACKRTCLPEAWPKWVGDPNDPATWDAKDEQVVAPLREIAERCEEARASCVRCLSNLDRAGLTCGTASQCGSEP